MLCVSQALAVAVVFLSGAFLHRSSVLCSAEPPTGKNVKAKMEIQDWTSALGYWGNVSDPFQN